MLQRPSTKLCTILNIQGTQADTNTYTQIDQTQTHTHKHTYKYLIYILEDIGTPNYVEHLRTNKE